MHHLMIVRAVSTFLKQKNEHKKPLNQIFFLIHLTYPSELDLMKSLEGRVINF